MKEFWIRTLTGILFLVVMVFGLIWDRTLFGALFVIILWVAQQEFYTMALGKRFRFQQKLGLVAGAAAFLLVACHFFYGWDIRWLILVLLAAALLLAGCTSKAEKEAAALEALRLEAAVKKLGRAQKLRLPGRIKAA